jgi:DNA ligase 1
MLTVRDLAEASATLAATRSRTAKVGRLAALLRAAGAADIGIAARWCTGQAAPEPLGIGPAQVEAARATPPAAAPTLTLPGTMARLTDLAAIGGSGAKARRAAALADLFAQASADEQRWLARLLLGELRQGALESLVLDALAVAFDIPIASVRRAHMLRGDIAEIATIARAEGRAGLDALKLQLFRPLMPMLAQPAADLDDALAQMPQPILEYKLDGARVQIHKQGETVRVYSRQGNEVTAAVPEVVAAAAALPARELVLDGETLALAADGRPLPFQVTMRRFGRHSDDAELRAALPLSVFCFDCLALDGETLIDRPTRERHRALADSLPPGLIIPRLPDADANRAEAFLQQAFAEGHEGLMAKHPDAPYAAGGRGSHWLKVKQAHTLDLVVLAAEWGSGRRSGLLSNLHLGCRDGVGGFLMLGKTFKGLTDRLLAWQTEQLGARALARDGQVVHVRPELVVEVAFNELQQSRQYPAGLALRFARVKGYRADKTAAEADDIQRVRALFARQLAYQPAATGASAPPRAANP